MSETPPPFGPPSGPPSGPPPQSPPPDEISYGSAGDGRPPRGSGRRWALVGVGVVAAGAVVAGAAFGAASLLGAGSHHDAQQPSSALPASTVAYASIDTDPADGQVGDLLGILAKFPGITSRLTSAGGGPGSDPRKLVFDALSHSRTGLGTCHLSWDADFAPWLGNRFAVAGVPVGAKAQPVAVAQVTDTAKAAAEVTTLQGCDHDDAYQLSGSWLLIAPAKATLDAVAHDVSSGTLADDPTYQHWMGEVGTPGLVQGYVSPGVGKLLAGSAFAAAPPVGAAGMQLGAGLCPTAAGGAVLKEFGGAAATVRVRDGGIELETAQSMAGAGATGDTAPGTAGADMVTGLPSDTGAAIGISMPASPWETLVARLSKACGPGFDPSTVDGYLAKTTGLTPGDIDTLLGKGLALSVGPLQGGSLRQLATNPTSLPVALQFTGDASGIQQVLQKVIAKIGDSAGVPVGAVVGVDASGDRVVLGPSSDYRTKVLAGGGLGHQASFINAVPDARKASAIVYVDFNAFDALVRSASATGYHDYFAPLQALGIAGWSDSDHTGHSLLRITTD